MERSGQIKEMIKLVQDLRRHGFQSDKGQGPVRQLASMIRWKMVSLPGGDLCLGDVAETTSAHQHEY